MDPKKTNEKIIQEAVDNFKNIESLKFSIASPEEIKRMTPLDFDKLEQTKRLMQTLNKLTYRSKSLLHEFDKN